MPKDIMQAELLGTLDTSTLVAGVPQTINVAQSGPALIVRIVNRSNIDVKISYGLDLSQALLAQDIVPPLGELLLPFGANNQANNEVAVLPKNWAVWGQAAGAGVGNVYCALYFEAN